MGWEASADVDASLLSRFDRAQCAQLNRVAVARESRNWRLHERLFYALSLSVVSEGRITTFFSLVREPYLRLYKPWGIAPVDDAAIVLRSRGERSYRLVEGQIVRTRNLLNRALGDAEEDYALRATA